MERRRCPNRRGTLEVVLGSLFLASRVNIMSVALSEVEPQFPPYSPKTETPVNGTLVPVEIPGFGTKQTISDTEVLLGIVSVAVNRKQRGVLRFLERAELKEPDVWFRDDYRMAQQIVTLCDEGQGNAYSKAFFQVFSRDASQTRFWWRDRAKLWRLAQLGGSNTPLLHANLAKELDRPALIPDYDYSQVSSGVTPARGASRLQSGIAHSMGGVVGSNPTPSKAQQCVSREAGGLGKGSPQSTARAGLGAVPTSNQSGPLEQLPSASALSGESARPQRAVSKKRRVA